MEVVRPHADLRVGLEAVRGAPHVLTGFEVIEPGSVHVVRPDAVPDREWLTCDEPHEVQQRWGAALLDAYPFLVIPSACSPRSWNIVFVPDRARGLYRRRVRERLAI